MKCTFANLCLFLVFIQPGTQCKCLFYYKYLIQLQTGSILKRSDGKKQSEAGQYKDRSRNFFLDSFSIKYRQIRNVCFSFHFVCSPSFNLNRITYTILSLKDVISFMKSFYDARVTACENSRSSFSSFIHCAY